MECDRSKIILFEAVSESECLFHESEGWKGLLQEC